MSTGNGRCDRSDIADVVASLGVLVDFRRWDELVELFAPVVRVDYTSLFAGSAEQKPARELVDGWAAFLPRFTATQHLIGIPRIEMENDRATVRAPVVGTHFMGDGLEDASARWVVGGHYRMELQRSGGRWRISALTLIARWQEGAPPS